MQDDAIRTARLRSAFIPVTGLFIWQSFQPTYQDPRELSHPALSYEHIKTFTKDLGLLHMSPVERAGPVTGTNFVLGSYEKFQPGFPRWKKYKDPGEEFWNEIRKTKQGKT